jgi:hypothetical protein
MEYGELHPEDEGVFESTPETPPLGMDYINNVLDYEPNADLIPSGELSLFTRPLLGADSLAYRLFDEYKDGITRSSRGEFHVIDINIVPRPESSDETNLIEDVYTDNYIVSDAYSRFRMRLVAVLEAYVSPRGEDAARYRIIHIGVRDKIEKGTGLELFLNQDDSIDSAFAVDGKYCDRRQATPGQQLIVAAMINELLNPMPADEKEFDPDGDVDPDLQ